MISISASLVSLMILCACAATVKQTYSPNGKEAYSIDCSGNKLSWADCETSAGTQCGEDGYKIISKSTDQDAAALANTHFLGAASHHTRSILIECKG